MSHLEVSAVLPMGRSTVFELLRKPELLPQLLKDYMEVTSMRGAEELKKGSEYEFVMTSFGISQPVRIRVEDMVKGSRLTYRQIEGLFADWVHTTKFEEHGDQQTLVTDYVDYEVPFGLVGHLADDLFIRRHMRGVLQARLRRAGELLLVPL